MTSEMTDLATAPGSREMGPERNLSGAMEAGVKKEGIHMAFTTARAISRPNSATFAGRDTGPAACTRQQKHPGFPGEHECPV